eukprot:1285627-Prymnesium_polylepis.1
MYDLKLHGNPGVHTALPLGHVLAAVALACFSTTTVLATILTCCSLLTTASLDIFDSHLLCCDEGGTTLMVVRGTRTTMNHADGCEVAALTVLLPGD